MDANQFIRNVGAYPPDELARYEGKHVAWSEDGRQILGAADTLAQLVRQLQQGGMDRYVTDFIPPSEESFLGGIRS